MADRAAHLARGVQGTTADCRGGRAPCPAEPPRPRSVGLLPVPQRKDALLSRRSRQGLLSLLRLRPARQRDRLRHGARRPRVRPGAAAPGRAVRICPPRSSGGAEQAPGRPDHLRRQSGRRTLVRAAVSRPARAPRRPRICSGRGLDQAIIERFGSRLRAGRAQRAQAGHARRRLYRGAACSRPA